MILCGPPMVGKSSCARALSALSGCDWFDLDAKVEARDAIRNGVWRSCREIWKAEGEAAFRTLEFELLSELVAENVIVSTGGGVVEWPASNQLLRSCSERVVWLDAAPDLLWQRIEGDSQLPSYLDPTQPRESFNQLLARRRGLYEQVSGHRIDANEKTIEQLAEELSHILKGDRNGAQSIR